MKKVLKAVLIILLSLTFLVAAFFVGIRVFVLIANKENDKLVEEYENKTIEISDIENKLASVRRYFNSATKELNNAVQTFPSNLIAGMFGFHKEIMFDLGTEQRANLEQAPKINF